MTAPVTKQHRLSVARALQMTVPNETNQVLHSWAEGKSLHGAARASFVTVEALERLAQLVADAEGANYRGSLGTVRVIHEAGDVVHYRALGPRQQMPRGNFLTLYRRCEPLEAEESSHD